MANIKSAQKKARKDIKLTKANTAYRSKLDKVINDHRKSIVSGVKIEINKSYSLIDKAAKHKIISKQKAAKLKSKIASS